MCLLALRRWNRQSIKADHLRYLFEGGNLPSWPGRTQLEKGGGLQGFQTSSARGRRWQKATSFIGKFKCPSASVGLLASVVKQIYKPTDKVQW